VTSVAIALGAASAAAALPAEVSVENGTFGPPVPSGFIGLGLEYRTVPAYVGTNPRSVDPVFIQLIRNLTPGQRPVLRIGGESTDRSWWPVPGTTRPLGVTYDLTRRWIATARALALAIRARLILGINLEADSTAISAAEARALLRGIGSRSISGLEIGNEPELYTVIPWYVSLHGRAIPWYFKHRGRPVLGRPLGYNFRDFTMDFSRVRKALPLFPLAGPATGSFGWLTNLPQFLAADPDLRWVTFHRYGLNGCVTDRTSPHYPTVSNLLATTASRGLMQGVADYIALAHSSHTRFLIDEMNSVTCGGRVGVSDTFASALWSLDALFEMASVGVDGVQIHTFQHASNGLFDFQHLPGGWVGSVRPEYYGLLMFAEAAPPGSRLLQVAAPITGQLRSWATLARDGLIRVVLINDSLSRTSAVVVRPPVPSRAVTLVRLRAPSAYATTGVTLAGQSFGSQTVTGTLGGPRRVGSLKPVAGRYTLSLPASSAALLTFSPSQPVHAIVRPRQSSAPTYSH
jgi:hypothetical protein